LLPVGGDHHDGAAFAGSEVWRPYEKAGEENRAQCKDETLAGTASADEPSLEERRCRRCRTARALLEDGELIRCQWQSEQRSEKCEPRLPRRAVAKPLTEHVLDRIKDGDGRFHAATSANA
jgi:hypothetical protein